MTFSEAKAKKNGGASGGLSFGEARRRKNGGMSLAEARAYKNGYASANEYKAAQRGFSSYRQMNDYDNIGIETFDADISALYDEAGKTLSNTKYNTDFGALRNKVNGAKQRTASLKQYLSRYYADNEKTAESIKSLDEMDKYWDSVLAGIDEYGKYYGQWATEDDYNKYVKDTKKPGVIESKSAFGKDAGSAKKGDYFLSDKRFAGNEESKKAFDNRVLLDYADKLGFGKNYDADVFSSPDEERDYIKRYVYPRMSQGELEKVLDDFDEEREIGKNKYTGEITDNDVRTNASTWYTDADGNVKNALGEYVKKDGEFVNGYYADDYGEIKYNGADAKADMGLNGVDAYSGKGNEYEPLVRHYLDERRRENKLSALESEKAKFEIYTQNEDFRDNSGKKNGAENEYDAFSGIGNVIAGTPSDKGIEALIDYLPYAKSPVDYAGEVGKREGELGYIAEVVTGANEKNNETGAPFGMKATLEGAGYSPDLLNEIMPDEKQMLYYLYNTGKKSELISYWNDYLEPTLSMRRDDKVNERAENAGKYAPITSSIESIVTKPVEAVEGAAGLVKSVFGANAESVASTQKLTQINQEIRNTVTENIDSSVGRFFYGVGMSIADVAWTFAVSQFTGGMFSAVTGGNEAASGAKSIKDIVKSSEQMSLVLMSSEAASNELYNQMNELAKSGEDSIGNRIKAVTLAGVAGFAEYITERVSIENFLGNPRNFFLAAGKSIIAEGSEEMASDIIDTLADRMFNGGADDINMRIGELMASGMTKDEASQAALKEWIIQVGEDGLAGAVSGLFFAGFGSAADYFQTRRVGGSINPTQNAKNNPKADKYNTIGRALPESIISEYGKKSGEGKAAAKALDRLSKGKRISNYKYGRMYLDYLENAKSRNISAESAANEYDKAAYAKGTVYDILHGEVDVGNNYINELLKNDTLRSEFEKQAGIELAETESDGYVSEENAEKVKGVLNGVKKSNKEKAQSNKTLIKVSDVSNISDVDATGKDATLTLTDGSSIKLSDVKAGPDEQDKLTQLKKAVSLMDDQSANTYMQLYSIAAEKGMSDSEYDKYFNALWRFGRVWQASETKDGDGVYTFKEIYKGGFFSALGEEVARQIYYSGALSAQANARNAFSNSNDNTSSALAGTFPKGDASSVNGKAVATFPKGEGKGDTSSVETPQSAMPTAPLSREPEKAESAAVSEGEGRTAGTVDVDILTSDSEKKEALTNLYKRVAEKLGINIRSNPELDAENPSRFIVSNLTMELSPSADITDFVHELGEVLKAFNPEGADRAASAIIKWYSGYYGFDSLSSTLEAYREAYAEAEGAKSLIEAKAEFANDALSAIFASTEGAQDFLEWLSENESTENRRSICQWFVDALGKLGDMIKRIFRSAKLENTLSDFTNMDALTARDIRQVFLDELDKVKVESREGEDVRNLRKVSKKVDIYTERDYNNFGWARANNVLTPYENRTFQSMLAGTLYGEKYHYARGKYVYQIPGEGNNADGTFVFTNGNFNKPTIYCVIKVYANNNTEIEVAKEIIYEFSKNYIHGATENNKFAERFFEDENFHYYDRTLFRNFREYERSSEQRNISGISEQPSENEAGNGVYSNSSKDEAGRTGETDRETEKRKGVSNKITVSARKYGALLNENERLRALTTDLLERTERTKSGKVLSKQARHIALTYLHEYQSNYPTEKLTNEIQILYDMIYRGDNDFTTMMYARKIADKVLLRSPRNKALSKEAKSIIDEISKTPVKLSNSQKKALTRIFGMTYNEFTGEYSDMLNISDADDATGATARWDELCKMYPKMFDEKVDQNEIPMRLALISENLRENYESRYTRKEEAGFLGAKLVASYLDVATDKAYRDRMQDNVSEEIRRINEDTERKLNGTDDIITALRASLPEEVKIPENIKLGDLNLSPDNTLAYEYVTEYELQKQKNKYERRIAEIRIQASEAQERARLKKSINKYLNNFKTALKHPTQKKYIPKKFIEMVLDAVVLIDESNIKSKKGKTLAGLLKEIKSTYEELAQNDNYKAVYSEEVQNFIYEASILIGDTPYEKLNTLQLESVNKMLNIINRTVVDGIKSKAIEKSKTLVEIEKALVNETESADKKYKNAFHVKLLDYVLRPKELFESFAGYKKDSQWLKMYEAFNKAAHNKLEYKFGAYDIFSDVLDFKKSKALYEEYKKMRSYNDKDLVDVGIKDKAGKTVKIPRGMMVELYQLLSNAQSRRHIALGGYTIPNFKEYYKHGEDAYAKGSTRIYGANVEIAELFSDFDGESDNDESKFERMKELTKSAFGTVQQIYENIDGMLNQYERDWIAACDKFFNKYSKDLLNSKTMEEFGYEIANVNKYYPIITDKRFITDKSQDLEGFKKTLGLDYGFLKERIVGARNPILLGDVTETVPRQIERVSNYCAFISEISDFKKMYTLSLGGGYTSLKNSLENNFGAAADNRLMNLLFDLTVGKPMDNTEKFLRKVYGNYAQAVLSMNLGVALGQAGSYPQAAAILGVNNLAKALAFDDTGEDKRILIYRANRELIDKYTKLLRQREGGNPMLGLENARNNYTLTQRLSFLTQWIEKVDMMTVGRLWTATEYYVQDHFDELWQNKDKSQEDTDRYYMKVAEVFEQVIEETQPNYSVMQRPEALRDSKGVVKLVFMFATQRLQNLSIQVSNIERAIQYRNDYKRGLNGVTQADVKAARTMAIKAVGSVIAGAAVLKLFKMIANFLQHRLKEWITGDDEVDGYGIIHDFGYGTVESLVSNIPLGGEVMELINHFATGQKYYGFDDPTVSSIVGPTETLVKVIDKLIKGDNIFEVNTDSDKLLDGAVVDFAKDALSALGVPANGIEKIINGTAGWMKDIYHGDFAYGVGIDLSTDKGKITASYRKYITTKDKSELISTLNALEDDIYQRRREEYPNEDEKESRKKAKSSVKTKISNVLKDGYVSAYEEKDIDGRLEVQAYMRATGLYDDIKDTCSNWVYSKQNSDYIKGITDKKPKKANN